MLLLWLLLLWGMKPGEGRIDNPKDFPQGRNAKPKDFPQGRIDNPKDYTLTVKRQLVVQEGLCILVPCKFSYPRQGWSASDPVHGYWFRNGSDTIRDSPVTTNNAERIALEQTKDRFYLLGDLKENNCSMIIRGVDKKDSGSYFFRLERGNRKWNYKQHMMTLHVTDLTNTPHVLIPETLEAGRPSNLTCSAPWACEPPTFSWTGTSVSGLNTNTNSSSVLTIIPQPWDHGTNLTCQVTLPRTGVTTRMTIRLNVSYAPKNLTVTICPAADSDAPQNLTMNIYKGVCPATTALRNGSTLTLLEGEPLHMVCTVDSNPPARLSWTLNDLIVSPIQPSTPGLLKLPQMHLRYEGKFTCSAQNVLGSQHMSLSLSLLKRKSGLMTEVVLTAVIEATVKVLILGLCLIFLRVRSRRKKTTRTAAVNRTIDMAIS